MKNNTEAILLLADSCPTCSPEGRHLVQTGQRLAADHGMVFRVIYPGNSLSRSIEHDGTCFYRTDTGRTYTGDLAESFAPEVEDEVE